MDMSEDNTSPSVLLRSLQEVPGLRKLKEEHVAALSWKVRQSCFAALLEELATHGVCTSESHRLKALVEARAAANKAAKAESYLAAPTSSLRLGASSDVGSAAAFRSAVVRCVSDALFAFGEEAPPASQLAIEHIDSENADGLDAAHKCRSVLARLAAECRARRPVGSSPRPAVPVTPPPPDAQGTTQKQPSASWSRLDLDGGGGAWANAKGPAAANLTNSCSSSSSSNVRSKNASSFVARPLPGTPRPPLSARSRQQDTPTEGGPRHSTHAGSSPSVLSARSGPRSSSSGGGAGSSNMSFSSASPGLSMSALPGQDSGASDKSREGGDSGGGKRDEVYEQSRATVAREEEDDDQEEETAWSAADRNRLNFSILSAETAASEHQQQAAGRVIDAVKSESVGIDGVGRGYWRELETESLRGQVRGLRRQVEMMTSAAEAQSAVTTAADQVLASLHSALSETVIGLNGGQYSHPPSAHGSSVGTGPAPGATSSPLTGVSSGSIGSGGGGTGTSGGNGGSIGGGAVGHLLGRLLAHTAGLRRELRAATLAARREEASRLRTPAPPQASPFLRPRLRRPRDLPSRGGSSSGNAGVGEWRRFAETTSATRPHVVVSAAASEMTSNSEELPRQASQLQDTCMRGRDATSKSSALNPDNNNDNSSGGDDDNAWSWFGEDCLWPPGGHSGLLETHGSTEDESALLALAEEEMQRASKSAFSQGKTSIAGGGGASTKVGDNSRAGDLKNGSFDVDMSSVLPSSPVSITEPNASPSKSSEGQADAEVQRIRAVASLEAVSPLNLASVMALAAAAQTLSHDLESFATKLHLNGTSTGEHALTSSAARGLSDRTAALAAAASSLAPLLPSPATAHYSNTSSTTTGNAAAAFTQEEGGTAGPVAVPPSSTSATSAAATAATGAARFSGRQSGLSGPGGSDRAWQRGRMAELADGISVRSAAGRQRLKALLVLIDASHGAWKVESSLLRAELEAWRSRDAMVRSSLGSLANDLESEWQRRAGSVLAAQLMEPLSTVLAAFNKLSTGNPKALQHLKQGGGGVEAALLVEALALHHCDLDAAVLSVSRAPKELKALAAKHRSRLAKTLAARPTGT